MTDKEKIITEIERLTEVTGYALSEYENGRRSAMYDIRKQLIEYINSLPAEQPSEDLEIEIERYFNNDKWFSTPLGDIARYFANWQKEQDKAVIERAEDHAKLAGIALGEKEAKEKFINKACEWLKRCVDVDDEVKMIDGEPEAKSFIQKNLHRIEVANQVVEDFKKAMEE